MTVIIFAGVGFMSICFMVMNADTNWRRARTNNELSELRDRLKKDSNDKQALEELLAALDAPYHFKRSGAASMLGQVGGGANAKEVVPALARAVTNEDGYLSREAALSLMQIGNDAREAIPSLIEALKRGDCDTASFSAQALGNMSVEVQTVVPALIACLDVPTVDQFHGARQGSQLACEAADALAKFGPDARDALPVLKSKLKYPNAEFQLHLSHAIGAIDPEDAESLAILIGFIGDDAMNSRALTALGRRGTNAEIAIPAVQAYLKCELSGADRQHALFTLQQLVRTNSLAP